MHILLFIKASRDKVTKPNGPGLTRNQVPRIKVRNILLLCAIAARMRDTGQNLGTHTAKLGQVDGCKSFDIATNDKTIKTNC